MRTRPLNRRVWVLPNRNSIGLVAVLLAMWYAGASQTNGAAYLLCFTLAGVSAVSVVHAWANLGGLTLTADPIPPAFAGEAPEVSLIATSARQRSHFGVTLRAPGSSEAAHLDEVPASGSLRTSLAIHAEHRGHFTELRVHATSIYPLGFFTARMLIVLRQPHFIYPKPIGSRPLPTTLAATRHPGDGHRAEGDDYGGVRSWQTGESQRHIDWKAAARGQPLLIKQWTGEAEKIVVFDWQGLSPLDTEARLSQLARWIIQAERGGASYGLRLPGLEFLPARGEAHYHACLRALAVFQSTDAIP